MKKVFAFLVFMGIFFTCYSQKIGNINNPQMGFTMSMFNLSEVPANQPILYIFLPNSNNFSPNVNIVTQEYNDSIEKYKEISDGQFKSQGMTVISSIIEKGKFISEYEAQNNDVMLHFYGIAYLKIDKIYLITGTSTKEQWNQYGTEIKRVVNSFEFTK